MVCGFGFGKDGKGSDRSTSKASAQLQERWSKIEYDIIDEISVIGKKILARVHSCVKTAKAVDHDKSFAGLNILFSGDFMQLPPVQDPALYAPSKISCIALVPENLTDTSSDQPEISKTKRQNNSSSIGTATVSSTIGRNLWLLVKDVVHL